MELGEVATWQEFFLMILQVVSDSISALLGMLPNPDPFPELMSNYTFDLGDFGRVAWYWLDSVFDLEISLSLLTAWFEMFAIAWIIQMLWKWMKAR